MNTWTIAYRKPKANKFHRITDIAMNWSRIRDLVNYLSINNPELDIWIVSTLETEQSMPDHEDNGNILTLTGKRVRITETGSLTALGISDSK